MEVSLCDMGYDFFELPSTSEKMSLFLSQKGCGVWKIDLKTGYMCLCDGGGGGEGVILPLIWRAIWCSLNSVGKGLSLNHLSQSSATLVSVGLLFPSSNFKGKFLAFGNNVFDISIF